MKSYTDFEQSKKLSEMLPLKSADMYYYTVNGDLYETPNVIESKDDLNVDENSVPCWSLVALLNVLPDAMLCKDKRECALIVETIGSGPTIFGSDYIDLCYEMILKLHESNK